jgi:uncharacterized protein YbjT (DUF2867 family)
MILMAGATGILGSEICRRLAATGKPIRAMVRHSSDAGKIEALKARARNWRMATFVIAHHWMLHARALTR